MIRFFFPVFIIAVFGCGGSKQPGDSTRTPSGGDTLWVNLDTAVYDFSPKSKVAPVNVSGQTWAMEWGAQLNQQKRFVIEFGAEVASVEAYAGFDAAYTFVLKNESGQIVFSKTLAKKDFRDVADWACLTLSNAELPEFVGYLPAFRAFAFTIDFWTPDSDVGETCLVMLNEKGDIIQNCICNSYGGNGCDGGITISDDGTFLTTCYKMIHADGRVVNLLSDPLEQVGVFLINNHTVLVIRAYDDKNNERNAVLLDKTGKVIHTFTYNGYYETLDYVVPMAFEPRSKNYYLLDVSGKKLTVIPQQNPVGLTSINFTALPVLDGPQMPGELPVKLEIEDTSFVFYTDPSGQPVRYKSSVKNED